MAETPQSAYDVYSAVCTATAANVPTAGYCVTTVGGLVEVATTTLLGTSSTGTYDGIALATGVISLPIQVQREGRVDKSLVPWLSTGAVEVAVADANGKPQRASASAGTAIGFVDKIGDLWISMPFGPLAFTTLYYQTVQANGVDQTQRGKLNFGPDFAETDESGSNRTTVNPAFSFWARSIMLRGGVS